MKAIKCILPLYCTLHTESLIIVVCAVRQLETKSRTSSVAVHVWNRTSVVWRGRLSAGVLQPRVCLRDAGPAAWLYSVHLPKAWRSAASLAGRSDCCTQSRLNADCPETGCCLHARVSLLLLHHCRHMAPSSPQLVPAACVLSPPQKNVAHSGSCHGEGKADVALPPDHGIRVCQGYQAFCLSLLNWRNKWEKKDNAISPRQEVWDKDYSQNHPFSLTSPVECGFPASGSWCDCPWHSLLHHIHWIWVCSNSWSV